MFQIFEGDEEVDSLRGTVSTPVNYISKGNNFTVKFQSDVTDQRRGFNATFFSSEKYCGYKNVVPKK